MPIIRPEPQAERQAALERGAEGPARHQRAVDDADVRLALRLEARADVGLRLPAQQLVEQRAAGRDLDLQVVVLDRRGVELAVLGLGLVELGGERLLAAQRRLELGARHLALALERVADGGDEIPLGLVDLQLELDHRRPFRLVDVQVRGVLALHLEQLGALLGDQRVAQDLGGPLGRRARQLVEPRLLADPLGDRADVVLVERLELLQRDVGRRVERDDVGAPAVGLELVLLVLDLLLERLDLLGVEGRGLAGDLGPVLDAPVDVGLGDAVGDLRGDLRVAAPVGDLDQHGVLERPHLEPAEDRAGERADRGLVVRRRGAARRARRGARVEGRVLVEAQVEHHPLGHAPARQQPVLGRVVLGVPVALEPGLLGGLQRHRDAAVDLDQRRRPVLLRRDRRTASARRRARSAWRPRPAASARRGSAGSRRGGSRSRARTARAGGRAAAAAGSRSGSKQRLLDHQHVAVAQRHVRLLAGEDLPVVDLDLLLQRLALAALDRDLLRGARREPARAGDRREHGDPVGRAELLRAGRGHLAEAEDRHRGGHRHVDQVVGEDRDVGPGLAAHQQVVDLDRDLVGQSVVRPAQHVDVVAVARRRGRRRRPAPRAGSSGRGRPGCPGS